MTPAAIKEFLLRADLTSDQVFSVVRAVAYQYQLPDTKQPENLDLIIRMLDRRDFLEERLTGVGRMIDAVAREAGLFPYLRTVDTWKDELAYELMKAPGEEGIVFHVEQAVVFNRLSEGQSVILSAPTSFGKSLLIDSLIHKRQPQTVVAVVPTIALLDEFRRRMLSKFPGYQIITSGAQIRNSGKAIYIGTQERLLERADIDTVDLFVIDEFYKLDLDRSDRRSLALNAILARFGTKARQIYFLGPSIDGVPNAGKFRSDLEFIKTRYSPVTADIVDRTDSPPSPERLIADLRGCTEESSLIYVRSPRAAWTVAYEIERAEVFESSEFCRTFGEWLKENFHPEWVLATSVAKGVGIHHGRIPRSIAYLMISLFNSGDLKAILCTSSMIEGVNTAAQNVFVYDRHISTAKLDRFTFDNIKGRAGRLFRHKIGKIFLYNPPPEEGRFEVRVPLFETDDRMVPELLVQLDDENLSPFARQRKRVITEASQVPAEILKRWAEFGVEQLNATADWLTSELSNHDSKLVWKGYPKFDQLEAVFEAGWSRLTFQKHDIRTPRQAAFFSFALMQSNTIRAYMDRLVKGSGPAAQQDIDTCFNFLRGAEYTFPQVLRALSDLVDVVIGPGIADYRVFAQALQNLFMPSGQRSLDEYGLPVPLIRKLGLGEIDDIAGTLSALLRGDESGVTNLSTFERDLLRLGIGS